MGTVCTCFATFVLASFPLYYFSFLLFLVHDYFWETHESFQELFWGGPAKYGVDSRFPQCLVLWASTSTGRTSRSFYDTTNQLD